VRVAVWTPLPPQRGTVAHDAYPLLAALARRADVVAVVRDDVAAVAEAPEGVEIVAASDYEPRDVDIDLYQMADDAAAHGYMHSAALRHPGLMVLHDPALVAFYRRIGGGSEGAVFREEVAFNRDGPHRPSPSGAPADGPAPGAVPTLLSRRLVEASLVTVVGSPSVARELSRRSPGADIACVPLAAGPDGESADEPEALAAAYLELLGRCVARRVGVARARAADRGTTDSIGVNAIGSWEATTGLAESARRSVFTLVDAGVDVAMEDYDYGAPRDPYRFPVRLRALPTGRPHDVDLCFLNVNELALVPEEYFLRPGHHRVVAYWHWEQVSLPQELLVQLDRVDEIWVSSEFAAETFRALTSKPVEVVNCVVEPVADTSLGRADFGLPEDSCLFLFHFDVNSTLARKNPLGVIEAYRRAFTPAERAGSVHLVMKTINLASHPEAQAQLQEAIALVGGTILDVDLRPEALGALITSCDVYVSLHRAEGFGLGMAEAMYFAKPVIGTAYSGNMEYMTVANSCPIGYRMTQIDIGDLRFNRRTEQVYRPGGWWADPDLDDAARWMRKLYADPGLRARLGRCAASSIREKCNSRVVGEKMRQLLERGAAGGRGRAPAAGSEVAASASSRAGRR
jgi:glycosyltransferase involved in cell wall biosynthesis